MSSTRISDYALLSDRHSAALVSRDGSIDWLCFPRFDSPSIFGRLLGGEAGHWSMRAMAATQVTRRYLDRTMVLETTFRMATGTVAITDALAMGVPGRSTSSNLDEVSVMTTAITRSAGLAGLAVSGH